MPRYTVTLDPPGEADVVATECSSLQEWREELEYLVDQDQTSMVLDLTGAAGLLAVPASARAAQGVLAKRGDAVVQVHVSTERAAELARDILVDSWTKPPVRYAVGHVTVEITDTSIVEVSADALVNASNTQLKLGSGVSGALAAACGPSLAQELARLGPIAPTDMAETSGYELRTARIILHVPTADGSDATVARAYENVLRRVAKRRFKAVGVPALGSGTGALPLALSAQLLLRAIVMKQTSFPDGLRVIVALLKGRGREEYERVFDASPDAERL